MSFGLVLALRARPRARRFYPSASNDLGTRLLRCTSAVVAHSTNRARARARARLDRELIATANQNRLLWHWAVCRLSSYKGEMKFITEPERGCCLFHREPFYLATACILSASDDVPCIDGAKFRSGSREQVNGRRPSRQLIQCRHTILSVFRNRWDVATR